MPESSETKAKMTTHFLATSVMLAALVRGDLDGYHGAAAVVAKEGEHGPPWSRSTTVREIASRAGDATTVADAADALAELGAACGDCHRSQGGPKLDIGAPPSAVTSGSLRMARHRWAGEKLWQGLMQPSDAAWKTGAEVFANAPLVLDAVDAEAPMPKQLDAFTLAARASAIAREASSATARDDRRRLFADLYTTCAGCHALAAH